jgi:ABC-type phosphate transport system ATPase subunit
MENGQVIETSDSKSFFENPKEERTKLFIQSIQSGRE